MLNLICNPPIRHPVVVIPVENDVAARFAASEVALGADGVALVQPDSE